MTPKRDSESMSRTSSLSSVTGSDSSQHRPSIDSRKPTVVNNQVDRPKPTSARSSTHQSANADTKSVVNGLVEKSGRRASSFMTGLGVDQVQSYAQTDSRSSNKTRSPSLKLVDDAAEGASHRDKRRRRTVSPVPSSFTVSSAQTIKSSNNSSSPQRINSRSPSIIIDQPPSPDALPADSTLAPNPVATVVRTPSPASPYGSHPAGSGSGLGRPVRSTRDPSISYIILPLEPNESEAIDQPETPKGPGTPSASTTKLKGRGLLWKEGVAYKTHSPPILDPKPGVSYALQNAACFGDKYGKYAQCHMCVTRKAGNVCLFRGVRSFPVQLDDPKTKPIGPPAFLGSTDDDEAPIFPVNFNQPFTPAHAAQIKTVAGRALLPTLEKELAHASLPDTRRIKLALAERSLCDTCLHAMFGGKFQCSYCGREQCLDCHQRLIEFEAEASAAGISLGKLSLGKQDDEDFKRLTRCSGRNKQNPIHSPGSFVSLTRFKERDLRSTVAKMSAWNASHSIDPPPPVSPDRLARYLSAGCSVDHNQNFLAVPLGEIAPFPTVPTLAGGTQSFAPLSGQAGSPTPPSADELEKASDVFHGLWSRGETMVVDVSPAGLDYQGWTPAEFAARVGDVACVVASNRTGLEHDSTVAKFFGEFGKGDESGQSVKIKDWPSSSDFASGLPDCFKMYINSIPFGAVTRLDGVLNVAAHYPTNANPPDLGPKGYFSEISDDEPGGNGSTKLHMDVADAVNLMLWAGPTSKGGAGFAAWDLFRAEDADKIREFLYELIAARKGLPLETVQATTDDPIHGQNFFLDRALRQQLFERKGVKPWRIYQKPGEVVFIPAGCAHQVCNFADCIKIASDFVSLENVQRCEKLTDEFRHQTKDTKLWRTDVLQLKSQLLWAWRSCERFDTLTEPDTAASAAASAGGADVEMGGAGSA